MISYIRSSCGPLDSLLDVGSGDGRVVIECVRQTSIGRGMGIEIENRLIEAANNNKEKAEIENRNMNTNEDSNNCSLLSLRDRIAFYNCDYNSTEFVKLLHRCSLLFIYILPRHLRSLFPLIVKSILQPIRIITYTFSLKEFEENEIQKTSKLKQSEGTGEVDKNTGNKLEKSEYRLTLLKCERVDELTNLWIYKLEKSNYKDEIIDTKINESAIDENVAASTVINANANVNK